MPETFGSYVAARLARLGLSVRAYARLCGSVKGNSFFSVVLRGRAPPPLKALDRWAAPLQLTASERQRFDLLAGIAHSPPVVQAWFAQHDEEDRRGRTTRRRQHERHSTGPVA